MPRSSSGSNFASRVFFVLFFSYATVLGLCVELIQRLILGSKSKAACNGRFPGGRRSMSGFRGVKEEGRTLRAVNLDGTPPKYWAGAPATQHSHFSDRGLAGTNIATETTDCPHWDVLRSP